MNVKFTFGGRLGCNTPTTSFLLYGETVNFLIVVDIWPDDKTPYSFKVGLTTQTSIKGETKYLKHFEDTINF